MYTNITHNTIEMMMRLNHKMRQDEAAAYRLAKEALRDSGMNRGAACRILAALGKQMVVLGARLQSRYGQQVDVPLVLTTE
jgi:hypothetical protein